MSAKSGLRGEARSRRAALARSHPDAGTAIARFAARIGLPDGALVGGYWPIGDEADPRSLMAALAGRGHALALACLAGPRAPLIFRAWRDGDPSARMSLVLTSRSPLPTPAFPTPCWFRCSRSTPKAIALAMAAAITIGRWPR